MFRNRKRLERLEQQAADAIAEREQMRLLLAAFEVACRTADVDLSSAAADSVPGVPPALIAACRSPGRGGEPVVLTVAGRKVVAVIGPGGTPEAWMPAITAAASQLPAGPVTTIGRAPLPGGLLAVAVIPGHSGLSVVLSGRLGPADARAAAVTAIRAARRCGATTRPARTAALVPLAAAVAWQSVRALHPAVIAGGAVAAAAGTVIAVMPPSGPTLVHPARSAVRVAAPYRPGPSLAPLVPAPGSSTQPPGQAAGHPAGAGGQPVTQPSPSQQSSPGPLRSLLPSPSPPVLQVKTSPVCVIVLGVKVCL